MEFLKYLVTLALLAEFVGGIDNTHNLAPKLTLEEDWKGDWEYVLLSDSSQGLFSKGKQTLALNCSASYPIQWKITGILEPAEFVHIQPYKRNVFENGEMEFVARILVFFHHLEDTYSSSTISCQKISDPKVATTYSIFVPGIGILVAGESKAPNVIPCPTTDPTANVTLYRVSENGDLKGIEASYFETTGFIVNDFVKLGTKFACWASADGLRIHKMHYTTPNSTLRRVSIFKNQAIEILCYSKQPNASQAITIRTDTNVDIKDRFTVRQRSPFEYALYLENTTQPINGTVKCGQEEDSVVWNFEILDNPPTLYLNNGEGEVSCLSEFMDRSIASVRCRDPSHCEFMKHCFRDHSSCNFRRQKQFFQQDAQRCWVQPLGSGKWCTAIPFYHLSGVAECGGGTTHSYFNYFIGLDYKRYVNWKDAPQSSLIKLDRDTTGGKMEIVCQASSFLFADSIRFSVTYLNGTEIFLKDEEFRNPSVDEHPLKMGEFNIVGVLKMNVLVQDVISVKCHAPWWNSTEYMIAEMSLEKTAHNCV